MNDEKTEITAEQVAKPEPQPAEIKPVNNPAKAPAKVENIIQAGKADEKEESKETKVG